MKWNKLLFLACFLAWAGALPAQSPSPRNVLFIIADDLNCNIGAYGHYLVQTPNIDRLAEQGRRFDNAFCNFPLCGPSRASMMTGLYPDQTGHHRLRDLIRDHVPNAVTLSQAFHNQGYATARVGKIYHYDNPRGIGTPGHDDPASWEERYFPKGIDKEMEDRIFSLRPGAFGATLSWLAAEGTDEEHTDGLVASKSIELLERYARDEQPFFLAVGFYKPHTPYVAPRNYFEGYPEDRIRIPRVPENYHATLPAPAVEMLTRFEVQNDLPDSLARRAIQAYYATISFLDAQVGRVLEALERLGLQDNTIVVFTSDHGYHMGEHGYYQKLTLFEDSGRIPLIIREPDLPQPGVPAASLVEMIDLYPTLTDLAGIEAPPYVAGRSLRPALEDPEATVRSSALTQIEGGYTLRTPDYRYTRWGAGGADLIELYDRRADPAELHNLAGDRNYGKLIERLDRELEGRIGAARRAPVGLRVRKGQDGQE